VYFVRHRDKKVGVFVQIAASAVECRWRSKTRADALVISGWDNGVP
jgi:hypothetical protein